jgi:phosphoribosylformylglycinamidine cyclo-ligase
MPGIYADDEYDMSGTIVGVVEKNEIINGKNIKKGEVLIGFPSNGLHTNGYSLARKVVLEKYKVDYKPEGFTKTIGEELLKTHKSYLPLITKLKTNIRIKGFSHITGGGIIGNTTRIIPKGLKLKIDWNSWEVPQLFKFIQTEGNISDEEMRKVFNIGIGLIAVVSAKHVDEVLEISKKMKTPGIVMGKVS